MKVALVHDYIKEYGGAERVLEALHEVWPEAPVFTSVYLPEFLGPHRERFVGWDIRTSWLQFVPFRSRLISIFRLISPLAFRSFNFSEFDVVIVSATGAYTPNVIERKAKSEKGEAPIHICYCHTPPRYLYGYATAREWRKNPMVRVVGEIGNHILRMIDFKSAQNVDYFVANSKNVAARIKKFYRKEATVIYPPVEVARGPASAHASAGKPAAPVTPRYFLAGGRLARPKHIDLIVRACRELNVPLKVFGKSFAGYEQEILRDKDIKILSDKKSPNILVSQYPNIQFLGEVTDEEKWELMRNAKAYIFASEDEDFGITPVEAMAGGTPVIAYRSGGVVESVIDGKTGVFFEELTVESLIKAMKQLNPLRSEASNVTINAADCTKQAKKFSKERFQREVEKFMVEVTKKKNARNKE